MKTVYWASVPSTDSISELRYSEPESVLKALNPSEFFGPNASKCPAIVDESKNTFKIKSPIDIDLTFDEDFKRFDSKYNYDLNFLQHFIGPFGPDKVIQLSSPTYYFFCEEPLLMTQLPPYYEQSEFVENCIGLSATFNINSWFRVVKPSFKLRKNKYRISFSTDDALLYLKFNTEDKIKMVRFDAAPFANNNTIPTNIMSFKFLKKNPLVPTKLAEGYEAFLKAKYNKRIMKVINENLLS
jgi:hypothetical protein